MTTLDEIENPDIELLSYQLAKQAHDHFKACQAGKAYIPKPALRAMGRRYLLLRDRDDLTQLEICEWGRLYAFFALVYAPLGDIPDTAELAIDFCNLVNHSPTDHSGHEFG